MTESGSHDLSDIARTSLITLYIRALESQRPDALIKDARAEALVSLLGQESLRKTAPLTEETGRVVMILKSREFDLFAQDFLRRKPNAVVVHIGCGLDTRFERVDDGRVEWYDLDLPEIIELCRKYISAGGARHHFLACSVFNKAWPNELGIHHQRPVLFIAEGVFEYFNEVQVKSLVLMLKQHFPSAELVFDAYSPFMRLAHNLRVTRKRIGSHIHWALRHSWDLERWGDGIRLLDAKYPFQYPEPRLRRALKVRLVPFLATGIGVFHYQL